MNLREIAELAVMTAWHGQSESPAKIPDEHLACYIRYTRLRSHVWHLCVDRLRRSPESQLYTQLHQEVLVSELLAQVVSHTVLRDEYNIGQRMTENVTSIRRILERDLKSLPTFAQALKIQRLQRRLNQWFVVLQREVLQSEVDYAVAMASIRIATPDFEILDERHAAVQRAVWDSVLDLLAWQQSRPQQSQLRNLILGGSTCN